MLELRPPGVDRPAARRLLRAAAAARLAVGVEPQAWADALERRFEEGTLAVHLAWRPPGPSGLVSWTLDSPLGATVTLLYLDAGPEGRRDYGELLDAVERAVGPVAFLHGPLDGLPEAREEELLHGRGFARFARSEMVRDPARPMVSAPLREGEELRSVTPADTKRLVELHRAAYSGQFDRYLFLEDADERADARREVGQIVGGRWGPLEPAGSLLLRRGGAVVGAVLSVRRPDGALIADVMVAPAARGEGVGRSVLRAAVEGLERAGLGRTYLNVTEGNAPALRLYRRLGFVRSLGPSRDWYNTRRIPVAPGEPR